MITALLVVLVFLFVVVYKFFDLGSLLFGGKTKKFDSKKIRGEMEDLLGAALYIDLDIDKLGNNNLKSFCNFLESRVRDYDMVSYVSHGSSIQIIIFLIGANYYGAQTVRKNIFSQLGKFFGNDMTIDEYLSKTVVSVFADTD
ncbi:MAG: hypothetical protein AAB614_00440 [Patescibacteria group bacterium]